MSNICNTTGRCVWLQLYNVAHIWILQIKVYSIDICSLIKSTSDTVIWSCFGMVSFDCVNNNQRFVVRSYLVVIFWYEYFVRYHIQNYLVDTDSSPMSLLQLPQAASIWLSRMLYNSVSCRLTKLLAIYPVNASKVFCYNFRQLKTQKYFLRYLF